METDFLNFHDEEHFGTALYQNELLDDSQSSILDIVGDSYHRQESEHYDDHSIIWEQDVERELNGDLAVIPMSGQINTFPKLSNSPPSKDFQKIFSDWQHIASIEATPSEDLTVDLQLPNHSLVVDMYDCLTPPIVQTTSIIPPPTITTPSKNSIVSTFDFSNTPIPQKPKEEPKLKKKEPKPIRKTGGKNLELLKQVHKVEEDLDTSFKSDLNISDELDPANDNFDITSYVNGGDDELLLTNNEKFDKKSSLVPQKSEKTYRKFGGCYEKNMPPEMDDPEPPKKEPKPEVASKKPEVDIEEDIDVETVSEQEQIPVLEARDLKSLLEQFEATEAVNPQLPVALFEPQSCQPVAQNPPETKPSTIQTKISNDSKKVVKQLNSELKQPSTKQKTLNIELINKIKAGAAKKTVSLIPARPSKKSRIKEIKNKVKIENIQFDHDYCQQSPAKTDTNLIKKSPKCDNITNKLNSDNLIDDTAIRIGKQIKNAINNENIKKQSLLKNQPIIKNSDGKVMISLLKNNRITNRNTIINTINTNDEQIQNIIVDETLERNSKKRKLNLEEYKKLRGEIPKTSCDTSRQNSPVNSGSNSPLPGTKPDYQELIMKMASEILKTTAKQKQTITEPKIEPKLEKFVPPADKKPAKTEPEPEVAPLVPEVEPIAPKIKKENYEMKTIVSIGVNTDESFFKDTKIEPKLAFKLVGKKKLASRNKFFDEKSPELNENSPKKKISEIITPIIQNCTKINQNSLITNITETLLQQSPKINSPKPEPPFAEPPLEHGEDKTVIILNKNQEKPELKSIAIQTEFESGEKKKVTRNYRARRDSSASSGEIVSSGDRKNSVRNSSSNSISSSLGSRWSRSRSRSRSKSRSRSRSRSSSHSEYSSYSSDSSRSKSRSISPRRWQNDRSSRNSRSRNRYSRSRRRSRSSSYRNYRNSRSPYSRNSRSRSNRRRQSDSVEREKMREVEERRVIYVGKISNDTSRQDLRRRFQSFGPITNVSVHFREHGDNYGFVTFAYKMDAYEAVERGNEDPSLPKYDISFGGRRAFCKTRYSDLDNIEADQINSAPIFRRDEDSFDILLREVQAKLRKRKV